jgi:Family of unknown function (DUF5691)
MSYWTELVDAAVLGARRAALPGLAPVLAGLADQTEDERDGTGLLRRAAVASRARRAGYVAAEAADRPAPAPAPADDRPAVSLAARQRLGELLAAGRSELVTEWVRLLGRSGRRPPEALLPALLTSASGNEQLRLALAGVLGPAGAWLATTTANPAWAWVLPSEDALQLDTWTTADHRARRELLERARQADPASGRELVAATWSSDGARDRAAFIAGLATGLSAEDEPLLNRALSDRSFEVRRVAAELLARLPGSEVAIRAADRAAAAVHVDRANRQFTVTPPTELTPEMAADGLQPGAKGGSASPGGQPPGAPRGHRGWMLTQVVAAPPVAWWTEHTGLQPAGLLALAERTDWADALRNGWVMAAIRDADPAWILALLDLSRTRVGPDSTQLMNALLPADLATWLAGRPGDSLFEAFELVPGPWPRELSDAVREYVVRRLRADPEALGRYGQITQLRRLLRIAAARLEPPAPPQLEQAEVHPRLLDAWAELMNTLSVRAAMRRELEQEPTP